MLPRCTLSATMSIASVRRAASNVGHSEWLDGIATWLTGVGVDPVLGAFVAGLAESKLLVDTVAKSARRR